jgi:SMI1 / KNR4 family (SUKH-1)
MTNLNKNIESYLEKMSEMGVVNLEDIQGCSLDEIADLERKYSIKLPASYKSFLLRLGKKFGNLVDRREYRIDYESVLQMTEYDRRINQECREEDPSEEILELPDNALLILGRCDGSQFYYILGEGGEDSAVYYYNTDEEIIEKERDSFWDILDMFLGGRIVDYG